MPFTRRGHIDAATTDVGFTLVPLTGIAVGQLLLCLCSLVVVDIQAAVLTGAVFALGAATLRQPSAWLSTLYGVACAITLLWVAYNTVGGSWIFGWLASAGTAASAMLPPWVTAFQHLKSLLPNVAPWTWVVGLPNASLTVGRHRLVASSLPLTTVTFMLNMAGLLLAARLYFEIAAVESGRGYGRKGERQSAEDDEDDELGAPLLGPSLYPSSLASPATSSSSSTCLAPQRAPDSFLDRVLSGEPARPPHAADAAAGSLWTPPPSEVRYTSATGEEATARPVGPGFYDKLHRQEKRSDDRARERQKPTPFRAILSAHIDASLRSLPVRPTPPSQQPSAPSSPVCDNEIQVKSAVQVPDLDSKNLQPPPLRQPVWPAWRPSAAGSRRTQESMRQSSDDDDDEERGSVI